MPLEFQRFPISFAQGLDTKSDPKQLEPGKLLALENGVFHETGAINKRHGYDALSVQIDGGDSITSGDALSTYRDELLAFGSDRVYSRIAATSKWADRGQAVSIIPSKRDIVSNGSQQRNPDMTYSNGLEVYAWEDSRGGIRYSVIDRATGAFIVADERVTPWGRQPKLVSLGGYVVIFFADVSALKFRAINVFSPRQLANEQLFTLEYATSYDVSVNAAGDHAYVAWNTGATNDIHGNTLSSALAIGSETVLVSDVAMVIGTWFDASGHFWISWHNGNELVSAAFTGGLSSYVAPTIVEAIANVFLGGEPPVLGDTVIAIAGIESSTGVNTIYYEVFHDFGNFIRSNTINAIGVVGTPGDFKRSVGLASKPFIQNGVVYLGTTYQSTLQSTYFLIDGSGSIVAKGAAQVGGGYRDNTLVAQSVQVEQGVYLIPASRKGRLIAEDDSVVGNQRVINKSGLFSLLGVISLGFNFSDPNQFQTTELGDNLYVIGGVVQSYDGVSLTEANFHLYPDSDFLSADPNDGSDLEPGQYQYIVVYEDTDNNGKIVRSTTSEILTVSIGGEIGGTVTLTGPMLRLTARTTPRTNCRIAIYRTEADFETFYRVTSIVDPLFNDPTTDTWSWDDHVSDNDLISRERLYTDGGVLDAAAPPGATLIHSYRNRVWIAGLEDPQELWYSQTLIPGEVVNFSPLLTVRADRRGGNIGALGSLDDALVIFKQAAIFRLSGDGPNNLGAGNVYDDPQLVTTDVGCTNPNSVATTTQGLVFQSAKGIMLLDRSYQVQYIGGPVERYNDLAITSTTVVPDQNIVVFTTASDIALVWDYLFNQWATFTNHAANDSIVWANRFCLLRPSGVVMQQNKTSWTDAGELVKLHLRTGFLNLAGLMGFQRIRRAAVLGEFKGPHTLSIGLSYDFNPSETEFYNIDASPLFAASTWGSSTTWGSDSAWGGGYTPYCFVMPGLSRQLCQSISFTIEDQQSSGFNEGMSLSGLTLEVGVKRGVAKVAPSMKVGV